MASITIDLPRICLITPEPARSASVTVFIEQLRKAITTHGIRLVQLRSKEMASDAYINLANQVSAICKTFDTKLIINHPFCSAGDVDCDGIHVGSARLMSLRERPAGANILVSAACHTPEDLLHAEAIGIDFAMLSPVLKTNTHPEAVPLGWEAFRRLVATVGLPVFALGGMSPESVDLARDAGAYGIAAINALWKASPPME